MSEWITNAITNQHIQQYEYSEFRNVTEIEEGEGAFAYVRRADWPCSERKVALKELKRYSVQKFIKEVNDFFFLVSKLIDFLTFKKFEGENPLFKSFKHIRCKILWINKRF